MTQQHTRWGLWALAVAVALGFCALGNWQLQRMHFKQGLLDQAAHVREQVVPLAPAVDAGQLAWAQGQGRWLPGQVLLDNQMREGQAGLKVYQPLQLLDAEPILLVDLGWVAWQPGRKLPLLTPQQGTLQLRGLLVAPPSAGLALGRAMMPAGPAKTWLATRIEPAVVADALQLRDISPQVLRLDPDLPIGYQRDLELLPNTLPPARHLGYAVQWFALALAVLICALVVEWRSRRAPRQARNRRA